MPEEWGSGGRVVADAVEEVGCVLVHAIVYENSFVLAFGLGSSCTLERDKGRREGIPS